MANEGAKNLALIHEALAEGVALPALVKADTETLRLQGTLQKHYQQLPTSVLTH